MDTLQATAFQRQLEGMRSALLAQIAEQRGGVVSRAEAAAEHFVRHGDSPAQVATEREIEFAIDAHELAEVNAIDAALARIGAGVYGECADCGCDIPPARLHANPEALRCIRCQESFEKKHPA